MAMLNLRQLAYHELNDRLHISIYGSALRLWQVRQRYVAFSLST